MRHRSITYLLILTFILPSIGLSHSGGTDSKGGHYNRKTGVYHYHGGGKEKSSNSNTYRSSSSSSSQTYSAPKSNTSSSPPTYSSYYSPSGSTPSSSINKCIDTSTGKKTFTNKDCSSLGLESISSSNKEQEVIASGLISLNQYFRQANENVGALSCLVSKSERNVSQSLKEQVRARDGNRCVICGSNGKLEVDHKRALVNGGSNSISNLATLCDDCHVQKTRMDTSLRRKREKLCR